MGKEKDKNLQQHRMSERHEGKRPKQRVIRAPAIRRAELIDCAQHLFLLKGYDKTTINDVIEATGLSKGAFYHHFRAKEDLLEAIAERFAQQSLAFITSVQKSTSLDALQRLNVLLAMSREWKAENLPQLRAMFTTMLRPENAVLYLRVINAVFSAMAPTLAAMIEQGVREGVFDVPDARTAADALLWLGNGRQTIVVQAMAAAETGDVDEAAQLIFRRLKAEETIVDRILGLPPGSVELIGSIDYLKALIVAWNKKR
ncbi:MAG: TetR/AcrR family transcriptional regulator [Alphaproteobacteria bacterium]|nr:TetR/AcrR family transcriptional regulator [Alphaproteobacteria bacterium]